MMYPRINAFTKNIYLEPCIFPTTKRRDRQTCSFDTVKVATSQNQSSNFRPEFMKCPPQLVQASWAILLNNYIMNDTVSFVVLSTSHSSHVHEPTSQNHCFDSAANLSVYQYQVRGHSSLEDVHLDGCWSYSEEDLIKPQMNTAIHFSNTANCTTRNNNGDSLPGFEKIIDQLDMVLEVEVKESYSEIALVYRNSTISVRYAQSIANSLHVILQDVLSETQVAFRHQKLISVHDHENILSWNHKVLYNQMNCMHYLVEAAARSTPHAEAICSWDGSLSYLQLNSLSSSAARKLGKLGVGPRVFVPFAYEKSMWAVVAALAILKAGGAFVPLDPDHPNSRLQEIIDSTRAQVVVCSELFASKFSNLAKCVVVISSRSIQADETAATHDFYSSNVQPSDPIFVLFTSGSTGKPKGMVHEHGAICTHAISHGEVMRYHGARVLQFAAHTFDVAIIDFFTTLIFGGCICIPSEEERRSNIIGAINNIRADYTIFTPSFARLINPLDVPTLKTIAVGGEALPQDGLQQWLENVSLIQIYGPAEVGICLSIEMRLNQTRAETVGFPLPNCSCWLVDPDDAHYLVPVGAIGELVVAGPSLAREYLNDEAKTRASFLENPPWAKSFGLEGTRFFKTGDLLRYNTDSFDGSFDFVSRKDTQIKLRGQRIEPGEIEHHVASIPGVAISMVTRPVRGYFQGQLVIVIEMHSEISSQVRNEPISLSANPTLTLDRVKKNLLKFLPEYMIPTVCLIIRSMPFVPSLKIDRRRVETWLNTMTLAPTEVTEACMRDLKLSPLNPLEHTAAFLSSKVIELLAGTESVPRAKLHNHDFVLQAAGIDSIQIISFSMFLQKTYEIKIPIAALFNSRITIRELAELIDTRNNPRHSIERSPRLDILRRFEALSGILLHSIEGVQTITNGRGEIDKKCLVQNVFVTGATGYLGPAILQKLLENPKVRVFALVRCSDEAHGLQRIIAYGKKLGYWKEEYASRIQVWKGDLGHSSLGLNRHQLECLRGTTGDQRLRIHGVIHNGAKVHYSSDYESLEPTNVNSTLILLELTALSREISKFIFVSGGFQPDDNFTAEEMSGPRKAELDIADGYMKTKIVSELLVAKCAQHVGFHGKQFYTIKPGYIVGSLESGISNQTDFIWRFISGCLEIGAYNKDELEHWLFISDIHNVADSVVSPIFLDGNDNNQFHTKRVLDGLHFSELWELLRMEFGYDLEGLSWEEWIKCLNVAILEKGEIHPLFPLLHVLDRDGGKIGSLKEPSEITSTSKERVKAAMKRNLRHLIEVGFIPEAKV